MSIENKEDKIKCGEIIKTKIGCIEGMITAISQRFDKITYEITFYVNGKLETTWLHKDEFNIKEEKQVGFNQNKNNQ